MNKLFPPMFSCPKAGTLFAIVLFWPWVFVLAPMWMPFMGLGIWENHDYIFWLELAYHVSNGVLMMWTLGTYLKDEWLMVTTDVKYYLKHTMAAVGLMALAATALLFGMMFAGIPVDNLLEGLPMAEMGVSLTPSYFVSVNPIFGTLCMVLFAPFSVCALFYALGFAPVCTKRPGYGYFAVIGLTFIPVLIDILWRGETALVTGIYLIQLPVHMVACWSYQKTDNIWTPILSLSVLNLLASLAIIILY